MVPGYFVRSRTSTVRSLTVVRVLHTSASVGRLGKIALRGGDRNQFPLSVFGLPLVPRVVGALAVTPTLIEGEM